MSESWLKNSIFYKWGKAINASLASKSLPKKLTTNVIEPSKPSYPIQGPKKEEKFSLKEGISFIASIANTYFYHYGIQGLKHFNFIIKDEKDADGRALGDIILGDLPEKELLGGLIQPKQDMKLKEACKNKKLRLVISAVEAKEKKPNAFHKPISAKNWKKSGVNVIEVPIEDYSVGKKDLTDNQHAYIFNAVKETEATRRRDESVYFHCKAGKSRSVFVLMCYLTTEYRDPEKKRALTVEEAYKRIKQQRKQVTFSDPKKWAAVQAFVDYYKKIKPEYAISSLQKTALY